MSTLTNQQIDATYQGLIKTTDNAAINATPKALEDGVGNALPIEVGTDRINFTDTIDFSGATVTGLPIPESGLVAGTGADSMKSADSLTTNPAVSNNTSTIAIGNGAQATANEAIAIGKGALASGSNGTAVGEDSKATFNDAVALGLNANSTSFKTAAIGTDTDATAFYSTAIGPEAQATAQGSVAIGYQVTAATDNTATVNLLQIAAYATMDFADDAAAATGGIPLGGVYHTSGALKIRIA